VPRERVGDDGLAEGDAAVARRDFVVHEDAIRGSERADDRFGETCVLETTTTQGDRCIAD